MGNPKNMKEVRLTARNYHIQVPHPTHTQPEHTMLSYWSYMRNYPTVVADLCVGHTHGFGCDRYKNFKIADLVPTRVPGELAWTQNGTKFIFVNVYLPEQLKYPIEIRGICLFETSPYSSAQSMHSLVELYYQMQKNYKHTDTVFITNRHHCKSVYFKDLHINGKFILDYFPEEIENVQKSENYIIGPTESTIPASKPSIPTESNIQKWCVVSDFGISITNANSGGDNVYPYDKNVMKLLIRIHNITSISITRDDRAMLDELFDFGLKITIS